MISRGFIRNLLDIATSMIEEYSIQPAVGGLVFTCGFVSCGIHTVVPGGQDQVTLGELIEGIVEHEMEYHQ